MVIDDKSKPIEGTVTVERAGVYSAHWTIRGNKLIVYFGPDEEGVTLGMFEREPETLARILLAEMIDRKSRPR